MLQNSGKVLDNASPIITSRLAKNIRVSVIKTPVLDEDTAGVAASIQSSTQNLTKEGLCGQRPLTEEMLDFLSACLRYGVSICGRRHQLRQDHGGGLAPCPPSLTASGSSPSRTAP